MSGHSSIEGNESAYFLARHGSEPNFLGPVLATLFNYPGGGSAPPDVCWRLARLIAE